MGLCGFTVTLSTERDLVVLTLFCGGLVLWSRVLRIEGWRVTLSTDQDLVVLSAVQWRFGPGFHGCMVCGFLCGYLKITTIATATTTATATTERLFKDPRVYWLVFPSTDRGQVVLRFVRELGSFQPGRLYLLSIFP